MNRYAFTLGAALVCGCDDRHEAGDATADASIDSPRDVHVDARDATVADRDAAGADATATPDGKGPLDDAGFPEHWSDRCGGAAEAHSYVQYHLTTAGLTGDTPACGALTPGGPARWLSLTVGAGESAAIRVARDEGGPLPSLRVFEACGGACVPARVRRDGDGSQLVWWRNDTGARRVYAIAVGAAEPGARGRFWVWPRVLPTGANDRCARAEARASVLPIAVATMGDEPSRCAPRQGPTVWYAFSVGTGDRLVASTEPVYIRLPAGPHPTDLHVLTDCDASCVTPVAPAVDWINEGPAATVRLGATAPDPNNEVVDFSLTASVRRAPGNARCESAAALPDAVPETTVWSASAAPACVAAEGARAVYYRATVGAGETIQVSGARGDGQQRFAVLDGCGGACLGSATADATQADARWTNTSATPRAVIVAATGVPRANEWSHAMTSALGAAANHTRCAAALRVSDGTVLAGERPALIDGAAPCGATGETGAYYYAARVEAGDTLMVWGGGRFRLLDGCASATCVDLGGTTVRDDSLVWRNGATTARDVVVAMSLPRARQARAVDVRVAIGRPAYTMTRITAECEDMSAGREVRFGTTYLGSTGSAWEDLPFAMPYFGATMRAWRLADHGGAWLAAESSPGTLSATASFTGTFPAASLGPFVMPLLDSSSSLPFVGAMRVRTVEGARRHMTLDVSTTERSAAPYLRHQMRLYADGAVEFHYCEVMHATRYDATNAHVAMQGGAPLTALTWTAGFDDAVAAGMGVRFTPR